MRDVAVISALVRRFPDHARSIRRLHASDRDFRTICKDYEEALRALEYWQAADRSCQHRVADYRELVKELGDELLAALRAHESE